MAKAIGHYMAMTDEEFSKVHIALSNGNSKIGKVLNVSLPAILTCGANCKQCRKYCYDIKACMQYKNVMLARARNYVLLQRNPWRFWKELQNAMDKRKDNKYLRFQVGGDIVDIVYLHGMVTTARFNPDWKVWTYTKQYDIVNRYITICGKLPENMTIMYSEWKGLEMENPYNQPEFRVIMKGDEKPEGHYCPGNCDICKHYERGCIAGETTYCLEH